MPRRLLLSHALVALAAAGACASCSAPAPDPLQVRLVETHYEAADSARTLFFRIAVVNRSDTALALTAFAYATDDEAEPPARALYPPRALASMPARRYAMGRPDLGQPVAVAARDSAVFSGALPLPTAWITGQPIRSDGFRDLTVYLYAADGRTLLRQQWPLRPGASR